MKKLLIVLAISLLLVFIPISSASMAIFVENEEHNNNMITNEEIIIKRATSPTDEPPKWANGNFSGVWGIDIWGEWHIPIGWMFGYYKRNPNIGYFYAGFAEFEENNVSWFIKGFFFGPFMFGSIGENEYANESLFVGLGGYNETHYHWRVMGQVGPTFFMYGEYTKFE